MLGSASKDGLVVGDPENGFSDKTSEVVSKWCYYTKTREDTISNMLHLGLKMYFNLFKIFTKSILSMC